MVLENGWRMDDACAGRRAWVASRWDRMSQSRLSDLPSMLPASTVFDTCPICYERFQAADVVINLPCNHNFHAVCYGGRAAAASSSAEPPSEEAGSLDGGICAWLASGTHSCPCCRSEVFKPFSLSRGFPSEMRFP